MPFKTFEQFCLESKVEVEVENKEMNIDTELDTKADIVDEEENLTDIQKAIFNSVKDKYSEADTKKLIKDVIGFCDKLDKKYGEEPSINQKGETE